MIHSVFVTSHQLPQLHLLFLGLQFAETYKHSTLSKKQIHSHREVPQMAQPLKVL